MNNQPALSLDQEQITQLGGLLYALRAQKQVSFFDAMHLSVWLTLFEEWLIQECGVTPDAGQRELPLDE